MESETARQALYTGLTDVLGPDLTASLMSFLPLQPATELATKADINGLADKIDHLDSRLSDRIDDLDSRLSDRIDQLGGRVDHLSDRMDRLQTTLLGGFAAMIAALLATGLLA